MSGFAEWFCQITSHASPWPWQRMLVEEGLGDYRNRLLRIPTGLGKTEGVLAAWAWHRLILNDETCPRRMVWCLPMRVLVEQTVEVARRLLERAATAQPTPQAVARVYQLMGGTDAGDWHLHPEQPAVLVGTQDMLLSRALNRGYAAGRGRWPMEYGLLNHDCLWIMDEVQLMDVGLATSVQLQAFREEDDPKALRPCSTWWMSATLQSQWLATPDSRDWLPDLQGRMLTIPPKDQVGPSWTARKPITLQRIPAADDPEAEQVAAVVWKAHQDAVPDGVGRVTLAIVNRVKTATQLHAALRNLCAGTPAAPDLQLIHSRFRQLERKSWPSRFLSREHCNDPKTNRIVVATQVIEAGVDISATALVTELAPWASMVQRFGRAARYGGTTHITVIDRDLRDKEALPYEPTDLDASREALRDLSDAGLKNLEEIEASLRHNRPDLLRRLYPYEPLHLLTRQECDELFDTSPDLTGADLDISRFIRSGEERDVFVCWVEADWDTKQQSSPGPEIQPLREGLCPVPVYAARKWLVENRQGADSRRAWIWDYLEGRWRKLTRDDCYPGQVILVDAALGGYDPLLGFTGSTRGRHEEPVPTAGGLCPAANPENADRAQARDDLSQQFTWKTILTHGREAARTVRALAGELKLAPNLAQLLDLAARLHDWGKAHPAFQSSILSRDGLARPARTDLAKAPKEAWAALKDHCCLDPALGRRHGFRHELASVLALFELLWRVGPDHAALLGPYQPLLEAGEIEPVTPASEATDDSPLINELEALDGPSFNLLVYLICCHHGKVRCTWQGTPQDQKFPSFNETYHGQGQPLRGLREGDELPAILLATRDGLSCRLPPLTLHLDPAEMGLSGRYGPSWVERVSALRQLYGPFALAYLEALLRVADIRASGLDTPDPLLEDEGVTA
ncbi:MAG: DEAD/DEAH box helicase [Anaerolineaceae bacterium]|nr:DEAD/DEAH box helicase [Anaerolineaceae bacterium]